jgi:hypothetical protein
MRIGLLLTIFSSISGMIMCTFYFLFRPGEEKVYKQWRKRARTLVLSVFLLTSIAICALISITWTVMTQYFVPSSTDLCNYTALYVYLVPFIVFTFLTFAFSIYLVF